jgi:3-oxoacyl-[acyl-carrier protein] reductase
MDLGLKGKRVIISGSTSGLGLATASQLLLEGAVVCINGRNIERLDSALKHLSNFKDIFSYQADITQEKSCADLVTFANVSMGGVDILITNCGGPPPGTLETLDSGQWRSAIDQSFLSHVFLIKYALPFLKISSNPSILTVTSFTVKQPLENLILSNSIRAATVSLTKSLSKEFGEFNIRVNSILPGWTYTQRVENLIDDRVKRKKTSSKEEIAIITDKIPLSRMASPEEFGRAATFLVSPAASYINGVMLNVDGGLYDGLF